jgi:DNA-binding NarL/FixJ family response regulator
MTPRPAVFIVDDFEPLIEMLTELLAYEADVAVCGSATSGAAALDALTAMPDGACELAVVDVSMPEMTGIELVRRLREERPGLRCLMLSGHEEGVYTDDAQAAGAVGFVNKADPVEIVAAIKKALAEG